MPTTPVGQFEPNALGLFDVIGNVWEWTGTVYGAYEGTFSEDGNIRMVLRGGDWYCDEECSLFTRYPLRTDVRGLMDGGVGFRCVLEAGDRYFFACLFGSDSENPTPVLVNYNLTEKTLMMNELRRYPHTTVMPILDYSDERWVEADTMFQEGIFSHSAESIILT